jgi:hypothetical protein
MKIHKLIEFFLQTALRQPKKAICFKVKQFALKQSALKVNCFTVLYIVRFQSSG